MKSGVARESNECAGSEESVYTRHGDTSSRSDSTRHNKDCKLMKCIARVNGHAHTRTNDADQECDENGRMLYICDDNFQFFYSCFLSLLSNYLFDFSSDFLSIRSMRGKSRKTNFAFSLSLTLSPPLCLSTLNSF